MGCSVARFAIDPCTGDLSTADGGLDRETKDIYLMTVVAADGGGRRSGASLTITVKDINDQTPRFQGKYSTKVKENSVDLSPPVVLQVGAKACINTNDRDLTLKAVLNNDLPTSLGGVASNTL